MRIVNSSIIYYELSVICNIFSNFTSLHSGDLPDHTTEDLCLMRLCLHRPNYIPKIYFLKKNSYFFKIQNLFKILEIMKKFYCILKYEVALMNILYLLIICKI